MDHPGVGPDQRVFEPPHQQPVPIDFAHGGDLCRHGGPISVRRIARVRNQLTCLAKADAGGRNRLLRKTESSVTRYGGTGQGSAGGIRPKAVRVGGDRPPTCVPLSIVLALQISFASGLAVALPPATCSSYENRVVWDVQPGIDCRGFRQYEQHAHAQTSAAPYQPGFASSNATGEAAREKKICSASTIEQRQPHVGDDAADANSLGECAADPWPVPTYLVTDGFPSCAATDFGHQHPLLPSR